MKSLRKLALVSFAVGFFMAGYLVRANVVNSGDYEDPAKYLAKLYIDMTLPPIYTSEPFDAHDLAASDYYERTQRSKSDPNDPNADTYFKAVHAPPAEDGGLMNMLAPYCVVRVTGNARQRTDTLNYIRAKYTWWRYKDNLGDGYILLQNTRER